MPDTTDNHGLHIWAAGEQDWQHRDDMQYLETAVEIRDFESNLNGYTPKDGAKFFAVDSHATYLGDGASWTEITHKATQDHIDDTTNPHSVTASQADALPTAGGSMTGAVSMGSNEIDGIEYLDLLSRDGSGDNWRLITWDTDGRFVFQHYPSGGGYQDAFEIEKAGTVNFPVGIDATQVDVGTNTEIFESASGSTVLKNNAGNPVNIQLSPSGRAFLSGNATETAISTQDQWYQISGTWQDAHMNFLSHDGAGVMTYDGDVTTQIAYDVGGSYSSPDNNATYEIAMFKDGVVKSNTIVEFNPPRAGEVLSLPPIHGFTDLTTTSMDHSVRVRCTSGTSNLTIPAMSFRIKG